MNTCCKLLCAASLALASVLSHAAEPAPVDAAAQAILAKLRQARPDLQFGVPTKSPLPGFYEVSVSGGPVLYVNAGATHFIAGDLFALQPGGFVNLAEQQRQQIRKDLLSAVPAADFITFAPQEVKATLTVFTDIDCGYCRKFHTEVPELNKRGIAVRYLAFPRAGQGSESFRKLATTWCSTDRQRTLTRYKKGEEIPEKVCANNPIARQMELGERIGVTGTPALVLEDGTLVPGYRPAAELERILGVN